MRFRLWIASEIHQPAEYNSMETEGFWGPLWCDGRWTIGPSSVGKPLLWAPGAGGKMGGKWSSKWCSRNVPISLWSLPLRWGEIPRAFPRTDITSSTNSTLPRHHPQYLLVFPVSRPILLFQHLTRIEEKQVQIPVLPWSLLADLHTVVFQDKNVLNTQCMQILLLLYPHFPFPFAKF